jgi:hypothetical protein
MACWPTIAAGDNPEGDGMSVVYSLYDALVSIKVPDEKAKAVIDAMEREMMEKLATKADLAHVREMVSKDLQIFRIDFEHRLASMESRLIVKLGTIAGIWMGILFGLLKLTA